MIRRTVRSLTFVRQVITLRHQGMTLDEIASRTKVSERTVRRIIDDARQRMEAKG